VGAGGDAMRVRVRVRVRRRAVEEGAVQRGGEVLEVEHGDEGDEGERERVGRQEGAPAPAPVAVLRLHRRPHPPGVGGRTSAPASGLRPALLLPSFPRPAAPPSLATRALPRSSLSAQLASQDPRAMETAGAP